MYCISLCGDDTVSFLYAGLFRKMEKYEKLFKIGKGAYGVVFYGSSAATRNLVTLWPSRSL